MAITKILTINDSGRKFAGRHLKTAITYITAPEKTQDKRYVAGVNCQPQRAFEQMISTKKKFGKLDKRQGYHIIISFEEENLEPGIAFAVIGKFVEEYLGQEYEAIYAVHDNTVHTHGHIIFNSVNCMTGKKYRYEKGDWARKIQPITNHLCENYGLATMEIEMGSHNKNEYYKDWNEFRDGKLIWRDMIRRDVDACILQSLDKAEFLDMLQEMGYEIKQNKYLAIRPPGMQRFCRCKSLGEEYSDEMIEKRIVDENIKTYANREKKEYQYYPEKIKEEFSRGTKLTGIQKTYYAKVCRIQKLERLPYSKAWQYREEIRKLNQCHEEYMFLVQNGIHSLSELVKVCNELKEKETECRKKRRQFCKEEKEFLELFHMEERMEQLLPAQNSYLGGDTFFEQEHQEYEILVKQLKEKGYSKESVERIRNSLNEQIAVNYELRQKLHTDRKIAERMIQELRMSLQKKKEENLIREAKIEDSSKKQPKK